MYFFSFQSFLAGTRKEALQCNLLWKSIPLHPLLQSTGPDTGTARKWIEGNCFVGCNQAGRESDLLLQVHRGQVQSVLLSRGLHEIHDEEFRRKALW